MISLPIDIIRYIFEKILESDPLYIFDIPDWFEIGEYTNEEVERLILNSIIENFKLTQLHLLDLINLERFLKNKNFVNILNRVSVSKMMEIEKYLFKENFTLYFNGYKQVHTLCPTYFTYTPMFQDMYSVKNFLREFGGVYFEIVKFIYSIKPEYITQDDAAFKYAIVFKNLEMLNWLKTLPGPFLIGHRTFKEAIKMDEINQNENELLKYLMSIDSSNSVNNWEVMYNCIKDGYLNTLEYLISIGNLPSGYAVYECIWENKMKELKILFSNPKSINVIEMKGFHYEMCMKNKNIEMMKFLKERSDVPLTEYCCYMAIESEDFETLKWLRSKDEFHYPCHWRKGKALSVCKSDEMRKFVNENYKSQRRIKRENILKNRIDF
jgi:hypothetical protein